MGILKSSLNTDRIISATCDSCGDKIIVNVLGIIPNGVILHGSRNGKEISAALCIKCVEEKLGFIEQ